MEKLLEILQSIKPGVDFENEKKLIDDKVLDSLSIVALVSEIEDEFDVEISVIDILPENFQSAGDIYNLIERLEGEAD